MKQKKTVIKKTVYLDTDTDALLKKHGEHTAGAENCSNSIRVLIREWDNTNNHPPVKNKD